MRLTNRQSGNWIHLLSTPHQIPTPQTQPLLTAMTMRMQIMPCLIQKNCQEYSCKEMVARTTKVGNLKTRATLHHFELQTRKQKKSYPNQTLSSPKRWQLKSLVRLKEWWKTLSLLRPTYLANIKFSNLGRFFA